MAAGRIIWHVFRRFELDGASKDQWVDGIDDLSATMTMGRHIGRDKIGSNIHQGCQIENVCVTTAAVDLPRMPADARQYLATRLDAVPRFTTMREVLLHSENALDWLVEHLQQAGGEDRRPMKEHEFTLVLTTDSSEVDVNKLYGVFQDGTVSTIAGVPQIDFHRQSASLEIAIRSAIDDVRSVGFDVDHVELQPDAVLNTP